MKTSELLYCIGMESETASKHMQELCELAGVQYPPIPQQQDRGKQESLPDPFEQGESA